MKELVVLSGKGGTGKTSITGALAALGTGFVLVDCDVDAANLHIIMRPEIRERHEFIGESKAVIEAELCSACGVCADYCRFLAITPHTEYGEPLVTHYCVDPVRCEGCGVCAHICPTEAAKMEDVVSGEWYVSDCRFGPFVHGRLGAGRGNSGKLVSLLRNRARELAAEQQRSLIIVDGPPGLSCPAISSLTGASYALIVTEPGVSALHDMKRLITLTEHFNIPAGVVINKADISEELCRRIEAHVNECKEATMLGRIPYDRAIVEAQTQLQTLIEYAPQGETTAAVKALWSRLTAVLEDPATVEMPAVRKYSRRLK